MLIAKGPFCYTNVEDGLCLADEHLRGELAGRYPEVYQRMQARREFMHTQLNIQLDPSVLPLGNMPGWLTPYILEPQLALWAG